MDIGLSCCRRGDGRLAARIGARWAHFFADLSDGIPDQSDLVAELVAAGCEPIADLRTSVQALLAMRADEKDPIARSEAAIDAYIDRMLGYLERHEQVRHVEVWGSAECAQFIAGRGEMIHYGRVLNRAAERLRRERPDVTILNGGFGCGYGMTADLSFLEGALAEYSPRSFDWCNLHPLLHSIGSLEGDCATLRMRLQKARAILDEHCAGQPLVATGFGIPTVELPPPPPEYGRFWRPYGVRALSVGVEAVGWWLAILAVLQECGLLFACLIGHDEQPPSRFTHFCGLTRADGSSKPGFTEALIERLHAEG